MTKVAEIIVTLPIDGRFHYSIPSTLDFPLEIGQRVLVPFGPRKVTGFVRDIVDESSIEFKGRLKPISKIMEAKPMLRPDLIDLIRFAAEYYLEPEGEILRIALPPGLTAASTVRYRTSSTGKDLLSQTSVDPTTSQLLSKANTYRGVKKEKGQDSLFKKLLKLGYLQRIEQFDARDAEKGIEFVRHTPQATPPDFGRAHMQRKVYEAIGSSEKRVSELTESFSANSVNAALKNLEIKKLVERFRRIESGRTQPLGEDQRNISLSEEQTEVLKPIRNQIEQKTHAAFLLRGVTGSGKTEVYLRAIEAVRRQDRGAIILVPEIALTSQLESRFRARFGEDVVVLHSAMTDKQRRLGWSKLYQRRAGIALGPRSAVWAPVHNLGLVVVDEEHDSSFKQHSDVRYHGRDLALVRAHRADAVAILGSATPSLETRRLAKTDRIQELRLAKRYGTRPLPEVSVVDLGNCARDVGGEVPMLSRRLSDALLEVVSRRQQAIIFLNRRGFNTVIVCDDCGAARKCPSCDVSLTHHKQSRLLSCHYCGHQEPFATACGECGSSAMTPYGAGTQRVAESIQTLIPEAKVIRLDRDITSKAGALQETLKTFRDHDADILVGTQMVAKGHDFPKVTLVGIICADSSLAFPDFRAAEKTFQLVTQVAGRAGRAEDPGRVIIQTFQPKHYALQCAIDHDDERFYEIEASSREQSQYPPFSRMGTIRIESDRINLAQEVSARVAAVARNLASTYSLRVRGPAPAPIERIRDKTRKIVMLSSPKPASLVAALKRIKGELGRTPSRVDVIFDVDAYDLL